MSALDSVAAWDVPHAAAAVVGADGIRAAAGPIDRPFPLASVSKPIAAVAVLVAVEEGTIDLDDAVAGAPPGATVRHLLAHASGVSPDDPAQTMAGVGERRIYANAGFELLAAHVAAGAQMPFADYVRAALVEPLGLAGTDVSGSPAYGYTSTVADLATLLGAVVRSVLLAPETVAAMTTPTFPDLTGVLPGFGRQDPNPWGLGVEIRGAKSPHWTGATNSPATWGHFGRTGTFLWWDPAAELGCIVLTDRDFGPWAAEAWPALADAVLAEAGRP